MNNLKIGFFMLMMTVTGCAAPVAADDAAQISKDWAQHERYAADNAAIRKAAADSDKAWPEVVFMGNSITDGWASFHPEFFTSHNFAGRGISGQVTSQMLCRFKADVIDLHPKAVVICGGVNDLVGNNGPIDIPYIVDNVASMVDLARANDIIPIVATALPSNYAFWRPDFEGLADLLKNYNKALAEMCAEKNVVMADYYTPMADSEGGIIAEYSDDRLHPNPLGYEKVMEPVILEVIEKTLHPAGAQPKVVSLWTDGMPNSNGLSPADEAEEGVMQLRIANPELYVYPSENPNGVAILCCPGGAYYGVAIDHEGRDMADWLNSNGVALVVLRYRMPNGGHYEVPLSDAEQAMRILRSRAAEWGINPEKVGVMGFSAGGHLASTLATHYSEPDTRPDFQVLFYPVISMQKDITHNGSCENLLGKKPSKKLLNLYSNELQVNSRTPKAFITASADDDLVPIANSERYAEALQRNGVAFTLHIYPTGGHGWGFNDSFPYKPQWTAELEKWLTQELQ